MENKYSIQYNENTKEFSVESQKLESAYSYKTPEQFIREKGYRGNEILTDNDLFDLGQEYVQNQIVTFDEDLMRNLISQYRVRFNKHHHKIHSNYFQIIMTTYAYYSKSVKLQFLIDLWKQD